MTTPNTPALRRPPNPLTTVEDAAAGLVNMGLAASYDEARRDIEAARAQVEVAAEFVGGLRRAIGDPLPLPPSSPR